MSKSIIVIYPRYFQAFLQMAMVTVLITAVKLYLWDVWDYWFMLIIFTATFLLLNRLWIRKYSIDKNLEHIVINYPLAPYGEREKIIEFNSIDEVWFFNYASRSPSHLRIKYRGEKIRINCSRKIADKVADYFAAYGIPTKFPEENEGNLRKMPK